MPSATIYLVRHAQGHHNLPRVPGGPDPHKIPDPLLTDLGIQQCVDLRNAFPFHDKLTHVVASPIRRTLYTALHAFKPAIDAGKKVTAQPLVQEVSALPCDTGSEPAKLEAEFAGQVDLGQLTPGWNDKRMDGPWAPELAKLDERSRKARVWLRDLAKKAAAEEGIEEAHIVVVTHGGLLHFLTQDWDGIQQDLGTGWVNAEYRAYQFEDPNGQDAEAKLRETGDSWRRRKGDLHPLSDAELLEYKAVFRSHLQSEFDRIEAERQAHEEEKSRGGTPIGSPPTVYINP